ncbi:MAG: T9SS type A sorting domain-containing protein [Bacteroidota bacterium]
MNREIRNILVWCLFGLAASPLLGQTPNYSLGTLDHFPKVIVDTALYSFDVALINHDHQHTLNGSFDILISINGDNGTPLLSNYTLPHPVQPGDSITIPLNDLDFDAARFAVGGGGNVTHDIIVWPMRISSTPPQDSAQKNVFFIEAANPGPSNLSMEVEDFPSRIREGQEYDLRFDIINNDVEELLYQPVSIFMMVDGGNGRQIVIDAMPSLPVLPGATFEVVLEDYIFNPLDFAAIGGGGNVTHDIIVWPMKAALFDWDSTDLEVEYLDQAAFSLEEGVNGLPPTVKPDETYNIFVAAKNVGATTSSNPVEFYVQLDDAQPQLYDQINLTVEPDLYASTVSEDFTFCSYFGISSTDTAYFQVPHNLRFYAKEQNGMDWYVAADYPIDIIEESESEQAQPELAINPSNNGDDNPQSGTINPNGVNYDPNAGIPQHVIMLPQLKPNPFHDLLELQLFQPVTGNVKFKLYDLQQQPVMQQIWKQGELGKQLTIDTSNLLPGVYFYCLELNGTVYTGKIIKA